MIRTVVLVAFAAVTVVTAAVPRVDSNGDTIMKAPESPSPSSLFWTVHNPDGTSYTVPRGPGDYYAKINTELNGTAFQMELHDLVIDHDELSYADLWNAFKVTDVDTNGCNGATIDDIYSAKCWTPGTNQCGNYKKEGDCYNREHSWPKSWWGGGDEFASYTDLFHLFPSDGYDNARRSNYALGMVSKATYTTTNGSKLGPCATAGSKGTCWEPADDTKGLLARAYFYMSTAYRTIWTCCDTDGTSGSMIKEWMAQQLREWHAQFPPSEAEQRRNDIIYNQYQGNRNPFIDYPEWADKIDFSSADEISVEDVDTERETEAVINAFTRLRID